MFRFPNAPKSTLVFQRSLSATREVSFNLHYRGRSEAGRGTVQTPQGSVNRVAPRSSAIRQLSLSSFKAEGATCTGQKIWILAGTNTGARKTLHPGGAFALYPASDRPRVQSAMPFKPGRPESLSGPSALRREGVCQEANRRPRKQRRMRPTCQREISSSPIGAQ